MLKNTLPTESAESVDRSMFPLARNRGARQGGARQGEARQGEVRLVKVRSGKAR